MKAKLIKQVKQYLKSKYPQLLSLYKPSKSRAKWWAYNSKRLDLCAAQFAYMLHQIDNPIKDKTCLLSITIAKILKYPILDYGLNNHYYFSNSFKNKKNLND